MKKKTKTVEKEPVEVEIVESKESRIVRHITDRCYANGTSIDFSAYMFRIKVEGDEDNDPTRDGPAPYASVIYLDPKAASDLSFKLENAIKQYERKYGSIMKNK